VVFRYCDAAGNLDAASNPNGSLRAIAGICNAGGNVCALMPHPERAAEEVLGNVDGRALFEGLVAARPEPARAATAASGAFFAPAVSGSAP
jgi:phosphoribosylformylglycinamidine synthase